MSAEQFKTTTFEIPFEHLPTFDSPATRDQRVGKATRHIDNTLAVAANLPGVIHLLEGNSGDSSYLYSYTYPSDEDPIAPGAFTDVLTDIVATAPDIYWREPRCQGGQSLRQIVHTDITNRIMRRLTPEDEAFQATLNTSSHRRPRSATTTLGRSVIARSVTDFLG